MDRETSFIHLTDLHVGSPDDDHLHSDTTETLSRILDLVETVTPRPSFVVASGDLTNAGDAESFRKLRQIMARIDVPVIYALGNHDTRPGFYEGMEVATDDPQAPYDHDCVVAGIHIITLDSSTPGHIGGTLEDSQLAWLEQVLETQAGLPKLIVVHHPPALGEEPDLTHWRTIHFPQSQRFASILKGRGDIVGILSGHIHHDRVSVWHGIPVVVGTGQHAATDILRPDLLRMVRGASFGIGTIRKSGLTVAFVPLPSDRAELVSYPLEMLLARAMPIAAE